MNDLGIISIKQAALMLGYKGTKGFLGWCKRNKLTILENIKGKAVNFIELKMAIYHPLVEKLRKQHGDKWEEVFNALLDSSGATFVYLSELKHNVGATFSNKMKADVNENKFLSKLKSYGK